MEKYRIICRHEWFSSEGIKWTKWYQEMFTPITDTEDELKDILKECKRKYKDIEKLCKRKQEYQIEKFDYVPISKEDLMSKKRGRKKKIS